jgi:hypothetical protein
MVSPEAMDELRAICPGAEEKLEGNITYVYLPNLLLPCQPNEVDALLCIQQHGGYTTRLFLSVQIPGKGANWSTHTILSRTWYTWSWNNVPAGLRPAEILIGHLRAFR